ncbi:MAG: hypothetical protein IPJ26_17415 [Bacteroidetes bacterium]|nr:hypothetical protein [Bacteroidota bacterium]
MKLVIEKRLRVQPCEPGMIDGRDEIILADQTPIRWNSQVSYLGIFAGLRGLVTVQSQRKFFESFDQTEAFDIHLFVKL